MHVAIPHELAEFVQAQVACGEYPSQDAVFSDAVLLLRERKRQIAELREELRPALERLSRGEGQTLDAEALGEFFDGIRARSRQRTQRNAHHEAPAH